MLYVTTRNCQNTFTSGRAMTEDRGEDGGFYIPMREPVFAPEDLDKLSAMPFSQRIAEVLNVLFQTKLTRWDVEFAVGRNPVKLVSLRHRIVMGEFWHNPDWHFGKMEAELSRILGADQESAGSWLRIAVRAALLAAVCLELQKSGADTVDISMVSGDLLWPVSAWYARRWGFPVGNLVLCCNENKSLWELICHGQLRTDDISISTSVPEADVAVPAQLERLIYACGGAEETGRYLECCRKGISYYAEAPMLAALQDGNYVSVVSSSRIRDLISGAFGTHRYLLTPASALAYGGLLDYRAKKGSLRTALIICQSSPLWDVNPVCDAIGIGEEELNEYI